jgi:hypothetical protein
VNSHLKYKGDIFMSNLLVGAGKEKITPAIGTCLFGYVPNHESYSVHDDLFSYAFAFTDGDTKALFVSITLGCISELLVNELRDEIVSKYAIPYDNIIIAATHTHSGPNISGNVGWGDIDYDYYNDYFLPGFRKSVDVAVNSQQEVNVAYAVGESLVGVNRREITNDNKITFGQNPWGVHNPKMTLISFKNMEGEVIGNIVSYGCHGTSAGRNREITRDWSGSMLDALESVSGGITAFFNGPIGDQGPRLSNGKTVGDITYTEELGAVAAEDAIRIYNTLGEYKPMKIKCHNDVIKLPLLPRVSLEEAKNYTENLDGSKLVNIGKAMYEQYKAVIKSYEDGYVDEEVRSVPLNVLCIGDIAFVATPYELFAEINLRVDQMVKDYNVILLSNANGAGGYFPTQDALCRGGYEVDFFKYNNIQRCTDDGDYCFIKEVVRLFEDIKA